ncbi:MAG: enoyl-CoA hydratase-related protein, partial [Hyphomonadaceae bacterium]
MSAATSFETITLEIADKVAVITLNRPDKMNAFTGQMMLDMVAAFDLTDANDDVGAV